MGLLWTTIHKHEVAPAYPQEVHEHRAPTDDSIRLVREMEEKAREQITRQLVGGAGNELSGAVVEYRYDDFAATRWLYVYFKLNHKEIRFRVEAPDPTYLAGRRRFARFLYEALAKEITAQLMSGFPVGKETGVR